MHLTDSRLLREAVCIAGEHWKYLHTVPEMAFEEYKTTEYIKRVCKNYPVQIVDLGIDTGLVCYLDAGQDETVALRTDIDAVPTEHGPVHLCGHDAHTSTMLGAMHYLCGIYSGEASGIGRPGSKCAGESSSSSYLPYNILFIFQPAEEGTRGARSLLDCGLLEKVPQRPSRIFGIHNRPEVPCGDVVIHKGPLMSEKSVFRIRLTGKPGHGSLPHKCVDPIVAAGSLICGVQTIVSRNVDPFQPAICTFNSVTAGTAASSAPETATLTGYIRSFDHDTHKRMEERLRSLAGNTASAYECKSEAEITPMVPAVNNPEEMYQTAIKAAELASQLTSDCRKIRIVDSLPSLASEDFAVYGEYLPSFFYWVGSGSPGRENAAWHDPAFCMDPGYLEIAIPVLAASALV